MSALIPLLLLVAVAAFAALCLYDLARAPQVRYLPKEAWAVIILVSIPFGGIVYLAIGRGRAGRPADRSDASWARDAAPARTPPLRVTPSGDQPRFSAGSIVVERLSKHFGSVIALDDLSFEVRPGQVTGFLGPNGAGKTTTMRLILGLEAPTVGRTSVDGRPYRGIVRPLHEVGALLDAGAAHPGRGARSHVLSIAQSNGVGRHRVEELLERTGLAQVADRRLRDFSLGMRQRLGIVVALLGDPPILLFDEPVTGLDPEGVHWIRELFRSLAAQGRTVFVSSHLMSEMALTADHLIIIGRGRLLADTPMQAFLEANARRDVLLRSPRAEELSHLLVAAGAHVTGGGDGRLSVTGLEAPAIGELAAAQGIAVHELTPRHASLEDAYLDLTRESVEYRTGGNAAPSGVAGPER